LIAYDELLKVGVLEQK